MKYTAALIAASAAIASAQVIYNETTGQFVCPASNPNGNYCAGDSLQTNIIIRCNNGIGQPGNCNDNLAGQPPVGVNYAPCFQTSANAGDAACSKNCIVYYPNGTYVLPGCTPSGSSNTTTIPPPPYTTAPPSNTTTLTTKIPVTNTSTSLTSITRTKYPTGTGTIPPPNNGTTSIYPPPATSTSTLPNGSVTIVTLPPTRTPVGPTTAPVGPTGTQTTGPEFTGAADRKSVAGMAIGLGAAVVMLL